VINTLRIMLGAMNALLGPVGGLAGAFRGLGNAISWAANIAGGVGGFLGGIASHLGFEGGTPGAPPGWAWVGEKGPELAKMTGGEVVIPHGPSMAMAKGYANGTPGYAGAMGGQPIIVNIDGRQLFKIMQGRTLGYNVANNRRTGGGAALGVMAT
jgi:hypothetical protein